MSTDAEPFDWWQPFKTVNALSPDIPKRGQGEPSPAVLLVGRLAYRGITLTLDGCNLSASPAEALTPEDMDAIRKHRAALVAFLAPERERPHPSLEEHAERVRAHALGLIRREPSASETAEAIEQATSLRAWIDERWESPEKMGPDFYQELENRAYNAGLLSLWWGLTGDMAELRAFLQFMRDWQDKAGAQTAAAMTRADKRESAEWLVVAQAIGQMEFQATALKSPRLTEAAKVMRAMLTADRLRPEAPAKEARAIGAKKAAAVKHARTRTLKPRIITEMKKYETGLKWKNPAARKVAPLAFRWNNEARNPETCRTPYNWPNVDKAQQEIRRWLDK